MINKIAKRLLITAAINKTNIINILKKIFIRALPPLLKRRFGFHIMSSVRNITYENIIDKYIDHVILNKSEFFHNMIRSADEINNDINVEDVIKIYDKYYKSIMKACFNACFSSDDIKKLVNDITSFQVNRQTRRKKIITIIKMLFKKYATKYYTCTKETILKLVGNDIRDLQQMIQSDNFLQTFHEYCDKSLLNDDKFKAHLKYNICNELINQHLLSPPYRRDIENLNVHDIIKYSYIIWEQVFTDVAYIKNIIKQHLYSISHVQSRIIQGYNELQAWLAKDYPGLKLAKLDKSDIHIISYHDANIAASCYVNYYNNELHAHINISDKLICAPNMVLLSTIYHELIHAIEHQADTAIQLRKFMPNMSDQEFQDIAHNDDIWDQGINTVMNHAHIDARGYNTNTDINYTTNQAYQFAEPHEASLICYHCNWFEIKKSWDDDCTCAQNNQFICPKCHSNDVKLIPAGPGEKEIIDDFIANIHHTISTQHAYEDPDYKRLQQRQMNNTRLKALQTIQNSYNK